MLNITGHCCLVAKSYPILCDPTDCSPPSSSLHGISQQEYWSGLPFPSPGTLSHPGIKSESLVSPALAGKFFLLLRHQGSPSLITVAAAAKLLQSRPTQYDPIDVSPPGSPVPGILQARTLEWVAISFSNA